VLNDQEFINKCDAIALLYENDTDHLAYITDNFKKLPKLVPKVLIQTKTDMQQPGQQIMFIEEFAKELGGIKLCKSISVVENNYQDALDSIMQVVLDPSKGLTDESLEIAKSQNDGSFIEDWLGMSAGTFAMTLSAVLAGLSIASYYQMHKHKKMI